MPRERINTIKINFNATTDITSYEVMTFMSEELQVQEEDVIGLQFGPFRRTAFLKVRSEEILQRILMDNPGELPFPSKRQKRGVATMEPAAKSATYVRMSDRNHPPRRTLRAPPPSRVETEQSRRVREERADAAAIQLALQRQQRQNISNPPTPGPHGDAAATPGGGDAPGGNRAQIPQQGANQGMPHHHHTVSRRGDVPP
ncbi:uncharacterized protein LOC124171641 [Ischnura elegans]|uniref:uncharacterized protein LOC124171641 n=1 Tax=Ischnura elegans TaxID=197161 RepID=UPI001ED88AB3|nr:uncharacterized protein LOC124171641 [Ischnura elegans]